MELFSRGEEQLKQKDYARAYDSFTQYLTLSPKSPGAYYNRALAAIGLSKYDQALDDLDETIRLSPGDLDARYMRFRLTAERREALFEDTTVTSAARPLKQNLENALTIFMMDELNAILKTDPQDIWALNERGGWSMSKESMMRLWPITTLRSCCATPAAGYSTIRRSRSGHAGGPGKRWRFFRRSLRRTAWMVKRWLLYGECKFALGRRKEACDAFRRSMEQGIPEAAERYSTLCR